MNCPNCDAAMTEHEPCPECDHHDGDMYCSCSFCDFPDEAIELDPEPGKVTAEYWNNKAWLNEQYEKLRSKQE